MKRMVDEDLLIAIANILNPEYKRNLTRLETLNHKLYIRIELGKILTTKENIMDKLLALLRLESLKGSRTKLVIVIAGLLMIAHNLGYVNDVLYQQVVNILPYLGAYFGIEHVEQLIGGQGAKTPTA